MSVGVGRAAVSSARQTPLHTLALLALIGYLAWLWLGGDAGPALVLRDVVLGNLVLALPVLICLTSARRHPAHRRWILLIAGGLLSFLLGNIAYLGYVQRYGEAPFPSWADVGYLGLYPFLLAGAFISLRRRGSWVNRSVLLDWLIGSFAIAALYQAVVLPLLGLQLWPLTAETLTSLAYPVGDVLLLAAAVGLVAVHRGRPGRLHGTLAVGALLMAVADSVYVLRVAQDTYTVGTVLDGAWAAASLVLAYGTTRPEEAKRTWRRESLASLVLPLSGALLALVVLATAARMALPVGAVDAAVDAAVAALLVALLRLVHAFLQVRALAEARTQARTDDLTGLANRRMLYEEVEKRLLTADRMPFALALLDLDRFKDINDSLGHPAGDALLEALAHRLASTLRSGDLLARLGGDEFAVLADLGPSGDPTALADSLLEAFEIPFTVAGLALHVDVSIGIVLAPMHATSRSDLMRLADVAMYSAKRTGAQFRIYDPHGGDHGRDRLVTIEELRQAVSERQLVLHYQPTVELCSGQVSAFEALVRWQHPTRGVVYPDAFLPFAEQANLMDRLTEHVLSEALHACKAWHDDGLDVPVSVNLSATNLLDAAFPATVLDLLSATGCRPAWLVLEITESTLMGDPARAAAILARLREMGVTLAVDDFGTGYCSMAYLRHLPVQVLKLDRAFVHDLVTERRAAAIVRSTVELARGLGLVMVAEGVEDHATAEALRELGCGHGQGYEFARPMPLAAAVAWAREHGEFGRGTQPPPRHLVEWADGY